jgi:hypothetical protein
MPPAIPGGLVKKTITIKHYQAAWLTQHDEENLSELVRAWLENYILAKKGELSR